MSSKILKTCLSQARSYSFTLRSKSNETILVRASAIDYVQTRKLRHWPKKKPPQDFQSRPFDEYAGDLRRLPEVDKSTMLYKYRHLADEIEKDERLKKLTSIEFASQNEIDEHNEMLIRDRMVSLFGPDSLIEQEIAILTYIIRRNIPLCVETDQDEKKILETEKSIVKRKELLKELRHLDSERFEWLLRELKIRYLVPRDFVPQPPLYDKLVREKSEEMQDLKRTKLEKLRDELKSKKEEFMKHKTQVLAEVDRELEELGLSRSDLEETIVRTKTIEPDRYMVVYPEREQYRMYVQQQAKDIHND